METSIAFESFVLLHQNLVFTTAVRLLGCPAEAEDVSQEVFLRAYHRFRELALMTSVGGWLRVVTRNLCLNIMRRKRRCSLFSELEDADEGRGFAEQLPARSEDIPGARDIDVQRMLSDALLRLPPAQRVPLVLFHFEHLGYENIAKRLDIPISSVKTNIFRGRRALRRQLHGAHDPWFTCTAEPLALDATRGSRRETARIGLGAQLTRAH